MILADNTGNELATPGVISRRTEFPFWDKGDSVTKLVRDKMFVLSSAYAPLPLDTPHPVVNGALLAQETQPQTQTPGWVTYERIYAVPGGSFSEWTTDSFRFPGISGVGMLGKSTSNFSSFDFVQISGNAYILYARGVNLEDQKSYLVEYTVHWYDSASIITNNAVVTRPRKDIFGRLGLAVSVFNRIPDFAKINKISVLSDSLINRGPFNQRVLARVDNEILHSNELENLQTREKFKVILFRDPEKDEFLFGIDETDTIDRYNTIPNLQAYAELVEGKQMIVSKATSADHWMGNFYRVQTTFVRAI